MCSTRLRGGGYLLYRGWPNQLVFIDGQTDFYGEELTREYESAITLGKSWQGIFEKYQINWVIVETNSPLAQTLIQDKHWKILYKDETAVIIKK